MILVCAAREGEGLSFWIKIIKFLIRKCDSNLSEEIDAPERSDVGQAQNKSWQSWHCENIM